MNLKSKDVFFAFVIFWTFLALLLLIFGDDGMALMINPFNGTIATNSFILFVKVITDSVFVMIAIIFVLTIISMFYPKWEGKRKIFISALLSLTISICVGHIFKTLFNTQRPYQKLGDKINTMGIETPNDASMPSNHSSLSSSISISLSSLVLFAWSILVAFSRMFLGFHYLSDVLIGSILGVFIAYCSLYFVEWLYKNKRITKKMEWVFICIFALVWILIYLFIQ